MAVQIYWRHILPSNKFWSF